ncbi:MAG: DUF1684 domain-containing protein [Chloroflexota bacterium]
MPDSEYARRLQAWRSGLDADIRREDGLLALSGLFWLQKGINTVGSSPDCSICLPKPIPRLLGAFEFDGTGVVFHVDVGQTVEIDGVATQSASALRLDDARGASVVRNGDLAMAPLRHQGRVGVQVWNRARPDRSGFPPRIWFEVDEKFLVRGVYTAYPAPVRIKMPDALGQIQQGYVQGYVSFRVEGKPHNLDATETDDGRLFLQFRDRTNGVKTYSGGRYLHTEAVSEEGDVQVDFNKACNPPSAFTAFTTCTWASRETALNSTIEAGERYVGPAADRP